MKHIGNTATNAEKSPHPGPLPIGWGEGELFADSGENRVSDCPAESGVAASLCHRSPKSWLIWLMLIVVLSFSSVAQADLVVNAGTPTERFDLANRLYEGGKFGEAATTYESIVQGGTVSPPLWFNFGNACFKSGQIGRAIVAYQRAEKMTPRDPDVRANLRFARNQVQGPTMRVPGWKRWIRNGFSVNEWAVFAAVGVWLTFLSLAGAKMWPNSKSFLGITAKVLGVLTIFGIAGLSVALMARTPQTAVVTATELSVRNGPLEESASAFTVHDGAELRIMDRKDDWLQVTDGTSRIGWVKRSDVGVP